MIIPQIVFDLMCSDPRTQWLLQARLSTEDYKDAMSGLQRVRRCRYATLWVRYPLDLFFRLMTTTLNACQVRETTDRRVVSWTRDTTYRPSVGQALVRLGTDAQHLPFRDVGA